MGARGALRGGETDAEKPARLAPLKLFGSAAWYEDSRGRGELHIALLSADADAAHLATFLFAARRLKFDQY